MTRPGASLTVRRLRRAAALGGLALCWWLVHAALADDAASTCGADAQRAAAGVAPLPVRIASTSRGGGYSGGLYAPAQSGARPAIVLMHGAGGSACDLAWLAGRLAAVGYAALTVGDPGGDLAEGIDAVRSGVAFLRSPANPIRQRTRPDLIGLIGHSQGAAAVSAVQQDAPGVQAIVALDNLIRNVHGGVQVHVRAPALAEASDFSFNPPGTPIGLDEKKRGYETWRAAGVASMEVVLRGFSHGDFTGAGTPRQHDLVMYYARAWFDRWLGRARTATGRLLARRIGPTPVAGVLSTTFHSAAFVPGVIDCEDLGAYVSLSVRTGPPARRTTAHGCRQR